MKKNNFVVFAPKKGKAAEWQFYPNAKVRKKYPEAELEFLGMDAQEGEFLSLKALTKSNLKDTQVIEITEGRVDLIKFDSDWEEVESAPQDADNIWDINQMISAWSSDE